MSFPIELVEISCYRCGISFFMSAGWKSEHMASGESFCCPAGHQQRYSPRKDSAVEKLKLAEQRAEKLERELQQQIGKTWKVEGKLDEAMRRVLPKEGRCPVCQKVYKRLRRHFFWAHCDIRLARLEALLKKGGLK